MPAQAEKTKHAASASVTLTPYKVSRGCYEILIKNNEPIVCKNHYNDGPRYESSVTNASNPNLFLAIMNVLIFVPLTIEEFLILSFFQTFYA